jgi:hypothetical protein
MANLPSPKSPNTPQRGATMIEFALIIGILLLLVVGLIDIARYFTARALLNRAATFALAKAQIDPDFQIDLRTAMPATTPYTNFVKARLKIQNSALNLATLAINAPSTTPAMTQLNQFQFWDPIAVLPRPTYFSDILILLPGQHAIVVSSGEIIYHPTLCAVGDGCAYGDITAGTSFSQILLNHPVVVEARAEFRPLVPLLPTNLPLRIQVYGLFQKVSSALYPPSRSIPPSIP